MHLPKTEFSSECGRVKCAESRNDDYETDEGFPLMAAVGQGRSVGPTDDARMRTSKRGPMTMPVRPRSVSFRPAGPEMKTVVVTNAMLTRQQEETNNQVHKYGVHAINERALGKVVDQYDTLYVYTGSTSVRQQYRILIRVSSVSPLSVRQHCSHLQSAHVLAGLTAIPSNGTLSPLRRTAE